MVVLTDRFDETVEDYRARWSEADFFRIDADDFLVEHAQEAVRKAYLTGERERVVVLSARFFTPIAQNKLLKILEEPPPRTHFLLLTPSKSGLLPTIRSRLPIENRLLTGDTAGSGVDLKRFDLAAAFEWLQSNRRIDAKSASKMVQALGREVMASGLYENDEELLKCLEDSVRLLDMGSPPPFVLTRLATKLLEKRR